MLKRAFILIITILLIGAGIADALTNKPNVIIVSGQIINKKHGNAVTQHKVYINIPDIKSGVIGYYNEVMTDEEGFYIDTIRTEYTKGSIEIYTFDSKQRKVDSTVYFRFFRNTEMKFLVNLTIDMPFHTNMFNVRFKYVQKQGGSKFYYHFIDLTNSQNIVSRKWNFGDGLFSYDKNPDHTYLCPGLYRVKLTIEVNYSGNSNVSSFSKMILIPNEDYFHIGGQVFADLFPIDVGSAFLYYKDSTNAFIPVDTVTFDTLGYYIFYNLPQGDYIIKAQPCKQSEFYGEMCPTYYGDVMHWQNAEDCEVNATNWDYDINLIPGTEISAGEGAIRGNVVVDKGLMRFGLFYGENITIYLLDSVENNLTYIYTDEEGIFSFNSLTMGSYNLYPEVTGVTTSNIQVELSEEVPEVNGVIIELNLEGVNSVIPNNKTKPNILTNVYPNPVLNGNTVMFSYEPVKSQYVTCAIYDFLGNKVFQKQLFLSSSSKREVLPIDNLSNGIYLITVKNSNGNIGVQKLIINR